MINPIPPDPGYPSKVPESRPPAFRLRATWAALLLAAGCVTLEYYGAKDFGTAPDMASGWAAAGFLLVAGLIADAVWSYIDRRKAGR